MSVVCAGFIYHVPGDREQDDDEYDEDHASLPSIERSA